MDKNLTGYQENEQLRTALAESQAREAKLRWYIQGYCTEPWGKEARSQPADHSALNEALAKECERLKSLFFTQTEYFGDAICCRLDEEAAAHRAKGEK